MTGCSGIGCPNNERVEELVLLNRSTVQLLSEVVGKLNAYQAAIHSLIAAHPDRKTLANDFLERMDSFGEVQAKCGAPSDVNRAWQLILTAVTKGDETLN